MLLRLIFSLCLLSPTPALPGQVTDAQLNRWIEQLSVKKDPRFLRYRAVWNEIDALDSLVRCDVLQILSQHATNANVYCQIRVGYYQMLASLSQEYACTFDQQDSLAAGALHRAYAVGDPFLIAMGNRLLAGKHRVANDYGLAMMHLLLAIDAQDSLGAGNFYDVAFDQYMLGELQYHAREYDKSIASFRRALFYNAKADPATEKTIPVASLMFLHNTMGLAYDKSGLYDSAFAAYDRALALATQTKYYSQWGPLIQGNRGDVFYKLGQYDSAYTLLQRDVNASLLGGVRWADNAATSLQWIARIHIKRHKIRQGLAELHQANALLQQNHNIKIQALIYAGFMEAFEKLDIADSLLWYTKKYIEAHDTIERIATEARAEIVQVRLDNQNSINRIRALSMEKKNVAMVRNFIILLTILLTAFGLLYYHRQRLRMRLRQQRALEDARKAEAEADAARAQLNTFTQHLLEKNALVETLQGQLTRKEFNEEQIQAIAAMSHHVILTDEDWGQFRILFEKVYPGFIHQIRTLAPDITSAELRIAALSKLRISPKEASTLLGISPASVIKARQRLRHRLDLDQGTDLEEYFNAAGIHGTTL